MELINPNLLYLVGECDKELKQMLLVFFGITERTKVHYCLRLDDIEKEVEKNGEFPKAIFFIPKNGEEMKKFSNLVGRDVNRIF